jgi:hypothetical protein
MKFSVNTTFNLRMTYDSAPQALLLDKEQGSSSALAMVQYIIVVAIMMIVVDVCMNDDDGTLSETELALAFMIE